MVFFQENVAASTSVACWEAVLVKGSLLIWVTGTWPCEVRASVIINNREKTKRIVVVQVEKERLKQARLEKASWDAVFLRESG